MRLIKYSFFSLFILIGFPAFSQGNVTVLMKWKLKPGEIITYKTGMDESDTSNHVTFAMTGLSGKPNKIEDARFQKTMAAFQKESQMSDLITQLKEGKRNVIEIEMRLRDNVAAQVKDTDKNDNEIKNMRRMMAKMTGGVVLRGAIYEDGTIESFYTKNDQKNLIATLFQLPGKPVKVGDTWSPDIHFLSMDQNFICDSSYKRNNVTICNIKSNGTDQIVTMNYDIEEYVSGNITSPFDGKLIKTTMKMTHKAVADFSIDKGRWINYNGIMSISSSGIITSQSTKKITLLPAQ